MGVVGHFRLDFRHNSRATLKQHEADLVPRNVAVVRQNAFDKRRHFPQKFDADQSPADNHERKLFALPPRRFLNVRAFEPLDNVVP